VGYRTPQGFSWTLRLKLLGATDGEGGALRVESSRERHYIKYKIWVPDAQDATRTVVLRYRAANGLRFFEDHDELYWNITGDEWDVPIEAASARIELPPGATGVRAIAFNGPYGATARDAAVTVSGTTIEVVMSKPLGFREGLTAAVGWDKGLVAEPTRTEQAAGFMASNWPLAIPVVVFLGMFGLWYRVGRDPAGLPVTVQYEPPGGLTPAEAGTLIDESVDMRDITATIVHLAVGGYLKIEEQEEKKFLGLLRHREYCFYRLDPKEGTPKLPPYELRVLGGLFQHGQRTVRLSDLENEFYVELPAIRSSVFDGLIQRRLYRFRPDRVRSRWAAVGVIGGVLIGGFGVVAAAKLTVSPAAVVVAAILTMLIVVLFGRIMPARTTLGARLREQILGFEEFLQRVESDRFNRVIKTPEMFERFLPYAMAFGVEKKWAGAFRDIYREPPTWYVGVDPMGFNATTLSSRLSDLSSRAGSTMSSSPRSSGGSGFSGGSSGGGSGGGGGGGF
ncbi:MAG: DUF2207 domain-containing protein, partial [Gemmatimonadetes bacterium]|nr:DUF2207 domain-containing protein [Gemmatimonadota bacterium]